MSISGVRRWLYLFSRFLGDVNAVRRGRIGQRIYNRVVGRMNARFMRRVWK